MMYRRIIFGVTLALALAAPLRAADYKAMRTQARELLKARKYTDAARLLEQILATAPIDTASNTHVLRDLQRAYQRARTMRALGPTTGKLTARVQAAGLDAKIKNGHLYRIWSSTARAYYNRRQHAEAISYYTKALGVATAQQQSSVKRMMAYSHEALGRRDLALPLVKELYEASPKSSSRRHDLATIYFRLGQLDNGLALIDTEKDARSALSLAERLFRWRLLPAAEAIARKLADKDNRARYLLAQVLFEQKNFDAAAPEFERCIAAEPDGTSQLHDIARKAVDLYTAKNTLKAELERREKELATVKPADANKPLRRKLLVLLAVLKRESGDQPGALDALLARRGLLDKPPKSDWRLERAAKRAVYHHIDAQQFKEAEALVGRSVMAGITSSWTKHVAYLVLVHRKKTKEAAKLLAGVELFAKGKESSLLSAADAFNSRGPKDVAVRMYQQIIAMEPHNSVYDANAHVRLATHFVGLGNHKQAKIHCDGLNAAIAAGGGGIMNDAQFRQMEASIRYHAAGNDPAAVIEMVKDDNYHRCRAGINFLTGSGKPEQIPVLEELMKDAPPHIKRMMDQAILRIRGRATAAELQPRPINDAALKVKLAKTGKVLWIQRDPFYKKVRWGAVEKRFVVRADMAGGHIRSFDEALEFMGHKELTAGPVAFTREVVWVGTDHGLFAWDRQTRAWNAYSVGLKHLDVRVTKLTVKGTVLLATVQVGGKPLSYQFDTASGKWTPVK
jgi:tetratricopeptide (TPR) repeat protein